MHKEEAAKKKLNNAPWGTGMQIRFNNGYGISIQFGAGTYSDNHDGKLHMFNAAMEGKREFVSSNTAEIGLLGRGGGLWGDPIGYVDADKLPDLIMRISICQKDADMDELHKEYEA